MARKRAWPTPPAGWPTWCCTRTFLTTVGWIAAIPADLLPWAERWQSETSNKSKPWWKQKKSIMRRNLLRERWQQLPERVVRQPQAEQLRRYLRTVVLPCSAYYREQFRQLGIDGDSIRTLDDLQRLPFTTKADLLNTATHPQKAREFVVIPDEQVLVRRPSTVLRALVRGRNRVKQDFESEFRPIFMTFTTGRSAEPTPILYSQRDLTNLATAGQRLVEVCAARPEDRLLNVFPFAPHLAFWLAHYAGTAAGVLVLSSGGGKVMGTEGIIGSLRRF